MNIRVTQFIAIILTALAVIPGGAHLLEIANKINLDRDQYFTVQQIYRGWALAGAVLIAAMLANAFVAIKMRTQPIPMACAALAAILILVTLGVFFTWTFPANGETRNWTVAVENWDTLRHQWEWSHAANAILMLLSLCATTAASLLWSDTAARRRSVG